MATWPSQIAALAATGPREHAGRRRRVLLRIRPLRLVARLVGRRLRHLERRHRVTAATLWRRRKNLPRLTQVLVGHLAKTEPGNIRFSAAKATFFPLNRAGLTTLG